eukprot:7904731-Pyramimonas_sp.AAC.1
MDGQRRRCQTHVVVRDGVAVAYCQYCLAMSHVDPPHPGSCYLIVRPGWCCGGRVGRFLSSRKRQVGAQWGLMRFHRLVVLTIAATLVVLCDSTVWWT